MPPHLTHQETKMSIAMTREQERDFAEQGFIVQQDPALLARCSPIRQQLLGALPSGGNPLGENPEVAPSSQYWLTKDADDVPLRAWAEARASAKTP